LQAVATIAEWRCAQYDDNLASGWLPRSGGVGLMMIQLMVAGIGLILIGLGAIGYGIPVKEFGFGNTLILAGAIAFCTGVILLALHAAVRELTNALNGRERPAALPPLTVLKRPLPAADEAAPADHAAGDDLAFIRDRPPARVPADQAGAGPDSEAPPWQQDAARERERQRATASIDESPSLPPVEPPPARPAAAESLAPPESGGRGRRSLLFSSSRRERERAALAANASTAEAEAASDPRRNAFDEAWPEPGRARGEASLRLRPSDPVAPAHPDTNAPAAETAEKSEPAVAPEPEQAGGVTLLKSGEVDGMAYSLYSDGSIEARMPEGMMRFASIDDLRSYLDQRS
jgi:hypothetical protein